MSIYIPKFNKFLPQFIHLTDVFSPEEVDRIIDLEDLQNFTLGSVSHGEHGRGSVDKETRNSDIIWVKPDQHSHWLFEKFSHVTSQINQDFFLYDISHLEAFQYTSYRGEDEQHYDWHIDSFDVYQPHVRKISASIALSDADSYEGGDFEVITNGRVNFPISLKLKKGDVVFFASWMPHRVKPVTEGIRKSLVAWVMGPREL